MLYGSNLHIIGESHYDPEDVERVRDFCNKHLPDIICVESPVDKLYPSKSSGHRGVKEYLDNGNDVPLYGIDIDVSEISREGFSINSSDIVDDTGNTEDESSSIDMDEYRESRSEQLDNEYMYIESREEYMAYQILHIISEDSPEDVVLVLGKMHAPAVASVLSFVSFNY